MPGRASKIKGSGYERIIAKKFREFYGLDKSDIFRTPLSGGHETYSENIHPGDLYLAKWLRECLPVSIECKHQSIATIDQIFRETGPWHAWLKQTSQAAGKFIPVLIARVRGKDYAAAPAGKIPFTPATTKMTFLFNEEPWNLVKLDSLLLAFLDSVLYGKKERNLNLFL